MSESNESKEGGMLAYFGLAPGERAKRTLSFVAPYVLIQVAVIAAMSIAVEFIFPLPLWAFLLAGGPAVLFFFFYLARASAAAEEREIAEPPAGGEGPKGE